MPLSTIIGIAEMPLKVPLGMLGPISKLILLKPVLFAHEAPFLFLSRSQILLISFQPSVFR